MPKLDGENGNSRPFRSVPRKRLVDREEKEMYVAPVSTKYSPQYSQIILPITRNVEFGDKGELERRKQLTERRLKAKPDQVCSKGVESCFNSVNRVEELTK